MNIKKGQNPYYDTTTVKTTTLNRAFRFIVEALRSIARYRESAKSSAAAVVFSPRRRRAMYVVRSAYWIRFLQGAGDIAVALQSELRNHVALFGKSACKCASEVRGAAIARDPVAWDVGSLFFEPFFPSSQNLEKKRIRRRFVCENKLHAIYSYHLIHKIII